LTGRGRRWTQPASRQKGGRSDRPESNGPWSTRHEASPARRPEWHTARGAHQPGELARLADAGTAPGRGSAHQGAVGPSPQTAGEAACGQGVRLRPLPCRLPPTGHHATHRPPGHGVEREARTTSLGGGAYAGMACPVPTADPPLRAAGSDARRVPDIGLRPHLLAPPPRPVLRGVLRAPLKIMRAGMGMHTSVSIATSTKRRSIDRSLPAPVRVATTGQGLAPSLLVPVAAGASTVRPEEVAWLARRSWSLARG
jgi:hypothetical protein